MDPYPKLHLLNPDRLPHNRSQIIQSCTPAIREQLTSCTSILQSCSNAEALRYLNKISINSALKTDTSLAEAVSDEHNTQEKYIALVDDYMGVVRVSGDPLLVLIEGIFQGYRELLQEALMAGTSVDAQQWTNLRNGFESMLRYIAQQPVNRSADAPLYLPTTTRECHDDYDPLRRWVLGHHVFYVLIQSLIVAIDCFNSEIESDNLEEAETALALATVLMWSSESALRFAGDFSVTGYNDVVRPSMMPPHAPPGLSGQFSRDHVYLVKFMTGLKQIFAHLHPSLRPQHEQFMQALQTAYESHKFVCDRFVSSEQGSLRMNATSKNTAADVLEGLKKVRLKTVKPL